MNNMYMQEIYSKIDKGELILSPCYSRSHVWKTFAKLKYQNGEEFPDYVFCQQCKKLLTYKRQSTANLARHSCCRTRYILEGIVIGELDTSQPESSLNASFNSEEIENLTNNLKRLLTKWLIKNCRSYAMILDDDLKAVFQEFVTIGATFGKNIHVDGLLPSYSNVAKNVATNYEECLRRVREEIASVKDNDFGLAIDSWPDRSSKKTYIALTMHFLKNNFVTYRLLGLRSIEDHNICEAVKTMLNDFNCKLSNNCILATKGDNNLKKAFKDYYHIHCISELLNQALQSSIEEVAEIKEIAKFCVELVNFLKSSEFNRPLQDFCPNRYITLYKMFNSLDSNWNEIMKFLQDLNEQKRTKLINIKYLKALIKTLQPFEEALETLEEENSATLHLVFVYLHELKKTCGIKDSELKDFDFIVNLKERLQHNLDEIVKGNLTIVHKIALFLNPPTNKLLLFSEEEKESIENECIQLMMKSLKTDQQQTTIVQESEIIREHTMTKRKKMFSDFEEPETSRNSQEICMQELQCYKYMRVINSPKLDVFLWWEQQKDNLPLLYKLSCSILATPASCFSAQRIVSSASSLLCENTFDLDQNDTNVEQIMFINVNYEPDDVDSLVSSIF